MKKYIILVFMLAIFIAMPAFGATYEFGNPLEGVTTITDLVSALANFLYNVAISICAIIIVYAGFLFITSAGNQQKVQTAQKALTWALIGLAVVLIAGFVPDIIKGILYGSAEPSNVEESTSNVVLTEEEKQDLLMAQQEQSNNNLNVGSTPLTGSDVSPFNEEMVSLSAEEKETLNVNFAKDAWSVILGMDCSGIEDPNILEAKEIAIDLQISALAGRIKTGEMEFTEVGINYEDRKNAVEYLNKALSAMIDEEGNNDGKVTKEEVEKFWTARQDKLNNIVVLSRVSEQMGLGTIEGTVDINKIEEESESGGDGTVGVIEEGEIESRCGECGGGLFNICDQAECESLGNCIYTGLFKCVEQ